MIDWQDLLVSICERFSRTLLSMRISATGASQFTELVWATSRAAADQSSLRLPLQHLSSLPSLIHLEIDLPKSTLFFDEDLHYIAKACPNVETLRLCPMARFSSSPKLTLEGVATLTQHCRRLQNLALVLDARPGSAESVSSLEVSSRSLLRLHVGHSNVNDALQTTLLLSLLAPHLELLEWFREKNRPGYVEANAQGWQQVSDWLPHLQSMRRIAISTTPHFISGTVKPQSTLGYVTSSHYYHGSFHFVSIECPQPSDHIPQSTFEYVTSRCIMTLLIFFLGSNQLFPALNYVRRCPISYPSRHLGMSSSTLY